LRWIKAAGPSGVHGRRNVAIGGAPCVDTSSPFHEVVPDDGGHEHRAPQRQAVVSGRPEATAACVAQAVS
jgi:hypothetical protein